MRLGIVADIHGNWTALQAVIHRMDELGVERVLGCGDYLWTTTGDATVVNWLREMGGQAYFVRGNGDSMAYYERHKALAHTEAGFRILLQHEWWPGDCHLPLHHVTPATIIVHPGSVGAPFDADPTQAKFATLDLSDTGALLQHRAVPFDIEAANREIIEGRSKDIGHSYFRKMTESRLLVTGPHTDSWQPVPPGVLWSRALAR